jgi:hypothetical protein
MNEYKTKVKINSIECFLPASFLISDEPENNF